MERHSNQPAATKERHAHWLAAVAFTLAAFAAYYHTFQVPFLLDDLGSIIENRTLHDLRDLPAVLSPPSEAGVGGRPFANLTFALNYAWSGLEAWSYHLVNFAIHVLAALTLFGVVRRTLVLPKLRERFGDSADALAFAAAGLWLLHPLQTISVTYLSQRTESLASLFYLLTLYAFIRGTQAEKSLRWYALMIAACVLGIATKEIVVTAPAMILLFDRCFIAGTFRAAWQQRGKWFVALASSWLLLAWLIQGLHGRGAGIGMGISPLGYALVSCRTLLHYLRLALWPHPLVFDYGPGIDTSPFAVFSAAVAVAVLLVAGVIALRPSPAIGFCVAWFFVLLAPTTSFVPVAFQPVAENRVYLAVVGVIVLFVLALHTRLGRRRGAIVAACLAVACAFAAHERNRDYRDAIALWTDTVQKRPLNPRAHASLGLALVTHDRPADAVPHYETAVRLEPQRAGHRNDLGNTLMKLGRTDEAFAHYAEALRLRPGDANTHYNLANALLQTGRFAEAAAAFTKTLELQPDHAAAAFGLGNAHRDEGKPAEAIAAYETALRLWSDFPEARRNLGALLARLGRYAEASPHLEHAVQLAPNNPRTHFELGLLLAQTQQMDTARTHLEASLRLQPDNPEAHNYLALVLAHRGETARALDHFDTAIRLRPDYAQARNNYASVLAGQGRLTEARTQLEAALTAQPNYPEARENLERLKAQMRD